MNYKVLFSKFKINYFCLSKKNSFKCDYRIINQFDNKIYNYFTLNNNNNKKSVRSYSKYVSKVIEEHYEHHHKPIGFEREYKPPYTDTKILEENSPFIYHQEPKTFSDKLAWDLVSFFRIFTRAFFRDKYGHHAVVLETVAAVPGMVAGMLRHFKSLRRMERDYGWIGKLLEEAENERMHLLTWMQVIRPTFIERLLVIIAQLIYTPAYALLYIFSPKTAHRFVGYLEEEACHEYTKFLSAIDSGKIVNVPAPEIAKKYWNLSTIRDVVLVVRADEAAHRDINHVLSDKCREGQH